MANDQTGSTLGGADEGLSGATPVLPRLGQLAWGFVGCVAAVTIVVVALAAVSEIALPLTFAVVLAVLFKPLVETLRRHRLPAGLAAGTVVLGLLGLAAAVAVAIARGLTSQTEQIGASVDAAKDQVVQTSDVDPSAVDSIVESIKGAESFITGGVLVNLVSGIGAVVGLISGLILAALIMYYLLKDGTHLRQASVARLNADARPDADDFIGQACRTLRGYGRGRTVMASIVAAVIGLASLLLGLPLVFTIVVANFVGGYIPYIGAFIGGSLAVIVALGEGGWGTATIMLVVVLASNLLLENLVEPRVMGRTLQIHPLVVLVVTALGGIVGGIVGLILAVPAALIASDAISRLQKGRYLDPLADKAQPAVKRVLG